MSNLKNIDSLFVVIGLLIIGLGEFFGSVPENHGFEIFLTAFGGAVIGSAITLMYMRRNATEHESRRTRTKG